MKHAMLIGVLCAIVLMSPCSTLGQTASWTSLNGPTYAVDIQDIAVGYQGGQTILYIADAPAEDSPLQSADILFRPFKSTNGGDTWMSLNLSATRAIACVANNPSIVYAGANDGSTTQGIYKSTNGGATWVQKNYGLTHFTVKRLAVSPHDPNVIYAGMFLLDLSQGTGWLFKSTDGGESWNSVPPFNTLSTNITDIVFDPTDPNRVWVSANNPNSDDNSGVWRTDNNGATWERKVGGMGANERRIGGLDAVHSSPSTLYCATLSSAISRIYKTTDAGDSWAIQYSGGSTTSFRGVKTDPFSASYIYAIADGASGVLVSANSGSTWEWRNVGLYDYANGRSIAVNPQTSGMIYAGSAAAFYRSPFRGAGWEEKTRGMWTAKTTSVAVNGTKLFTGAQRPFSPNSHNYSLVNRRLDEYSDWNVMHSTWAYRSQGVIDLSVHDIVNGTANPDLVLAVGYRNFVTGQGPFVLRSTDNGITWGMVFTPSGANQYGYDVDFDPANENILYAAIDNGASGKIYKSTNAGASWFSVNTQADRVFAVEVSPQSGSPSQTIYAYGEGIRIIKSTNAGSSWAPANGGLPTGLTVYDLSIDPSSPDVVYAGTSQGIYKSTNGGTGWAALGNSPQATITSLAVHPYTTQTIYAATNQVGAVYKSVNGGQVWQSLNAGLPAVAVNQLQIDKIDGNTIYAVTDNGVYSMPHLWTGPLTVSTTWRTFQAYRVDGTLAILSTLTMAQGTTGVFLNGGSLSISGALYSLGTLAQPVALYGGIGGWNGVVVESNGVAILNYAVIVAGNVGITSHTTSVFLLDHCYFNNCPVAVDISSVIDPPPLQTALLRYVDISNCGTGVRVGSNTSLTMENSTISYTSIGVQIIPVELYDILPSMSIRSSSIEISGAGIIVDGFSNLTIEDNTLSSYDGSATGIACNNSSPTILRNRLERFKYGLYCSNSSSPVLDDGRTGGCNTITNCDVGVQCEEKSNANLGYISGLLGDEGGQNGIYDNVSYDVVLTNKSIVLGENNYWTDPHDPASHFLVDPGCEIDYDPWLFDPPTCGSQMPLAGGGLKSGSSGGDDPQMNPRNPLVQQALLLRFTGRFAEAVTFLRGMIGNNSISETLRSWAVHQVFAIAQRLRNPNLTLFLRSSIVQYPCLARDIRAILPRSYLQEGSSDSALAIFNANIQMYPNSALERAALYGKFLHTMYARRDTTASRTLHGQLLALYNASLEAKLADLQWDVQTGASRPTGNYPSIPSPSTPKLVAGSSNELPREFSLGQNYPNPFNPSTSISYALPSDAHVTIRVYDVLGREVLTLVDGIVEAGYHQTQFDGIGLSSGVYLYRMEAGHYVAVKKFVLLK